MKQIELKGKVIDLGAKNGKSSYYRFLNVENVTYVDFYERNENIIQIDLESEFPLKNNLFDHVILFNTLEHVFNYQNCLNESIRILNPGGKLHGVVPFLVQFHSDPYDYFRYTHQSLEIILKRAGFECVNITQIGTGCITCASHLCSRIVKFKPFVFIIWFFAIQIDKLLTYLWKNNKNYYVGLSFKAVKPQKI